MNNLISICGQWITGSLRLELFEPWSICQPSDPNGGEWPEHIGEMVPACARATRTLLNHTPIGECRRFFPRLVHVVRVKSNPDFTYCTGVILSFISLRVLLLPRFYVLFQEWSLFICFYRIVTSSLFWFFSVAYWGQFWVPSFLAFVRLPFQFCNF